MTIPTQSPWNSSHLERPREPREIAKAGQRRKCHIIELSECPSGTQAGQRGKCNRIDLSECFSITQWGAMSNAWAHSSGIRLTTLWQSRYVMSYEIGTGGALVAFQTKLLDCRRATPTCYP